jgi:pimeloyl-ACP methyl ester carboxylesterase
MFGYHPCRHYDGRRALSAPEVVMSDSTDTEPVGSTTIRLNGAGLTLTADAWGDPSHRAVVLMHGGGQTRHAWKRSGETLAEAGFHAITLDARGHGESGWAPDGDYTVDRMVDDLCETISHLGIERPVVVGASMGGYTALVAAGERRVDASAVVLVDVAPTIEREGGDKIRAFMKGAPDGFATLEEAADSIAAYLPHRPRPTSLAGLAKNLRHGDDGRYRWHWDPRFMAGVADAAAGLPRMEACASALTMPTLLVRGTKSDILSAQGAARFRELVPHSEYVEVPDATHMVAGDVNDVFGETVIEFLRRTISPGSG